MDFLTPKFWIVTLLLIATFFYGQTNLKPQVNRVDLVVSGEPTNQVPLHIALLSDLHISPDEQSLQKMAALWQEVLKEAPDIIMLAGDYVDNGGGGADFFEHRDNIASVLGRAGDIPVIAVLGNHEEWSEPVLWVKALQGAGLQVLSNEVLVLESLSLCVRGFGDAFSGQFDYISYPLECEGKRRVSLTHDPSGAFHPSVEGLVLAGHTHCGQIRIPFFGPIYVPSDAPDEAHCGLYEDDQRQVFVSSGIGTSVVPLRFNAQSQWDLITLK